MRFKRPISQYMCFNNKIKPCVLELELRIQTAWGSQPSGEDQTERRQLRYRGKDEGKSVGSGLWFLLYSKSGFTPFFSAICSSVLIHSLVFA